ncbi:hypothetical protein JST97_14795 [bacterium]|nr:hypothetical protein [bacterium]
MKSVQARLVIPPRLPLRSPQGPTPPPEPPETSGRMQRLARTGLHSMAELARWTEVDEVGALLLNTVDGPALTALNIWDGVVTLVDARKVLEQGRQNDHLGLQVGGVMRLGLGLGGMIPGMTGIVSEALLGTYCLGEGLLRQDTETTAMGLTQLGASVGLALMATGVGGHLGQSLAIASLVGRAGYMVHSRHSKAG